MQNTLKKLISDAKRIDFFTQLRSFTILISVITSFSVFIGGFIQNSYNTDAGIFGRTAIVLILALCLFPFAAWSSIKRKNYFGVVALLPALNVIILVFVVENSPFFYLFFAVVMPIFSIIYLIRKREIYSHLLIIAFVFTGITILGIGFFFLFLLQLSLIIFLFFIICYIGYHAIKDNLKLLKNLGRARWYYLLTKTFVLWCPLLIVIIPGFYLSGLIDQGALKVDEYIVSNLTSLPEYPIPPESLECGWNFFCYASPINIIKKQVNYQYRILEMKENISENSLFLSEIFRNILEMLSLFSKITLYFLSIRSFLYVFARIAVSVKYNLPATLDFSDNPMPKGKVLKFGHEYIISSTEKQKYYFVRTKEPTGCAPKISLPQWSGSLIGRIIHQCYTMNEFYMEEGKSPVHFSAVGSEEYIEWNLQENEEITFSYKNFVGMSESVQLFTVISFRLTSMIFGHVFHSCARGPGKLIFLTKGKANYFEDGTQAGSVPINRVLAWHRNAKFDIESSLNPVDVLMSGIYLKPSTPDMVIVDADERGAPQTGLIQFAKRFLLPI